MDAMQTYSILLQALGDTLLTMTSAEWDAATQEQDQPTRTQAAKLMLKVQHARLNLGNAAISAISDKLHENEKELLIGVDAVRDALDNLKNVVVAINTIGSLVSTIGKIISLV